MNNDTRNRIFTRRIAKPHHLAVLVFTGASIALSPLAAWADVPTPPPTAPHSAGFPSENALKNMGYDPKTGVWRVQETNRGKPTVKKDGGNITGTQGRNVTVTGKYGEKVNLQTSVSQTSAVDKLVKKGTVALSAITALDSALGSNYSIKSYNSFKNGDFRTGFENAFGAVLTGLSSVTFGVGDGINRFLDKTGLADHQAYNMEKMTEQIEAAQAQAEREGKLAEALSAAQAKKIAEEAAQAAARETQQQEAVKKQAEGKTIWVLTFNYHGVGGHETALLYTDQRPTDIAVSLSYNDGKLYSYHQPESSLNKYAPKTIPDKSFVPAFLSFKKWDGESYPEYKPDTSNLPLTESEIADILRRMLESNQTNHAELMRQLSMMGNVVSESTTNITYNQTTAKSAPYTPQGSGQAQQTQVTINSDGSITTNIIPRPDLKPDSSQAPTREQVVPNTPGENVPQNPNGQNQNPSTPEQNQQRQEFCKQNPTSAYCQDLGNTDYEDLSIPTNAIDMTLRPLDIFSTDGTCPAPLSFEFGPLGKFEISYDFLCKVARLIRPIAILGTMISCSFTAFAAIREL
ncbi:hypothetical protein CGZ77_10315 [Neisseria sp. KEM232]|uniref:virulence factor TspB C-terminal domain-related protein n=1 Tax=Neisseria sp. KEM232 TaxID=655307 RepID=UPI000B8C2AC0|nr:virulence factor TspB C-terminal domain-related protein [Neisseria sp. KEM232]ASP18092.1 hypothetical protein CGZ77_10315 [Neisseria sp. KEM232]